MCFGFGYDFVGFVGFMCLVVLTFGGMLVCLIAFYGWFGLMFSAGCLFLCGCLIPLGLFDLCYGGGCLAFGLLVYFVGLISLAWGLVIQFGLRVWLVLFILLVLVDIWFSFGLVTSLW